MAAFLGHPLKPPPIGLGLAALGRPGYINLDRAVDLGDESERSTFLVLVLIISDFLMTLTGVAARLSVRYTSNLSTHHGIARRSWNGTEARGTCLDVVVDMLAIL